MGIAKKEMALNIQEVKSKLDELKRRIDFLRGYL